MKRLPILLLFFFTLAIPIQTFAQGQPFWSARDHDNKGRLDRMLAELKNHKPAAPVRFNQSYEQLASTLEKAGRFRELGLTDGEGRILLRAVFKHLGIPENPVLAKMRNEKASETVVTLPGYRMKAEFEPIDAVLMTWPQGSRLVDEYFTIIRTILAGDAWIYFWVNSKFERRYVERRLTKAGIDLSRIAWIIRPLNSMWMRDYGPVSVYNGAGAWAVADFHYYSQRPLDDRAPKHFAELFNVPRVDRQSRENALYTEGGNLMTDGRGAIVYSQRTYSSNPRIDPSVVDARIGSALQSTKAFVPLEPSLDGTGHVDMFLKIINTNTIVIGRYNANQVDYQILEDCAAMFANGTNGDGQPWNVIRMPMPDVYYAYFVLPVVRTYINGLIVNDQAIVPVYGLPVDTEAINIFANALPGRTIVPINANDIIESAGAWHCVLMEYPRP